MSKSYPDLYILREGEAIDRDALRAALVVACDDPRLIAAAQRDMRLAPVTIDTAHDAAEAARHEYAATCGVSLIIPAYNYARFITQALDSVMAQTRRPEEIVVVNDASTDDTAAVVENYIKANNAEGLIELLTMPRNVDLAAAQNAGIAATTQRHIVCLDADDMIEPAYIETLHDAMLADRSIGVAYCGVHVLRNGQIYEPRDFAAFESGAWEWMCTPHNPPFTCIPKPSMFRREMWTRAGGFHQTYKAGEDVDFWLRGLATGWNARKVTEVRLFTYRMHGNGQMSRARKFDRIDHYKPWMRDGRYPFLAPVQAPPPAPDYTHPVVAVIIPVGPGHARHVAGAIESLIGQTLREWEVIVVKDTDEDLPLDAYPFARVIDGEMRGASHARNVGIAAARAPLVVFLDADDWLMPGALEAMLRAYAVGNCSYVYTDWVQVDTGEREVRHSSDYDRARMVTGLYHPVTIMIAREDAQAVGGFDETLAGFEDWELMAKLAYHARCGIRVPRPLLAYRVHTGTQRKIGQAARDERAALIQQRYGGLDMAKRCCGGNGDALIAARQQLQRYPPDGSMTAGFTECAPGKVAMEYIGTYAAPVTFLGKYKGGKAGAQYACVDAADVTRLGNTGQWRKTTLVPTLDSAPEPKTASADAEIAAKIARAEAMQRIQDARVAAENIMADILVEQAARVETESVAAEPLPPIEPELMAPEAPKSKKGRK